MGRKSIARAPGREKSEEWPTDVPYTRTQVRMSGNFTLLSRVIGVIVGGWDAEVVEVVGGA